MANTEIQQYIQSAGYDTTLLEHPWIVPGQQEVSIPYLVDQAKWEVSEAIRANELWTLPGTGFSVNAQMRRLFDSLESSPATTGSELRERISQWTHETTTDIVSFKLEYLSDRCVYPIQLARGQNNEIVCPNYGNVPYIDIVQDNERDGAVKSSARHVSDFLSQAPAGSVAFFTSPPGWSGLMTDRGDAIRFPDTQTYLFRVTDHGQIEAATVQTDMTVHQNKELLTSMGERFDEGFRSDRQEIADITSRVVTFDTTGGFHEIPFEEIVRRIQLISGSETASKGISFDSIYRDLHQIDMLMQTDQKTQAILTSLKQDMEKTVEDIAYGKASLSTLGKLVGNAVLSIAAQVQLEKRSRQQSESVFVSGSVVKETSYMMAPSTSLFGESTLSFLQSKPGCNGGGRMANLFGNSMTSVLSGGAFRVAEIGTDSIETSSAKSCEKIKCGNCSWEAQECDFDSEGNLKHTKCPECGWKPG